MIPAIRPFMEWAAGGDTDTAHAFMSVNMVGGIVGGPAVAWFADRSKRPECVAATAAALEAILLSAMTLGLPVPWLLALRTIEGALNVGGLSAIMALGVRDADTASGRRSGALGAAIIAGIAAGAPLGTVFLAWGPRAPVMAAAACALCVMPLVVGAGSAVPSTPRAIGVEGVERRGWMLGAVWVFAERFAVGCFVVTFAYHARHCLGSSDRAVGMAMTSFLVPFAVATYPFAKLVARRGAAPVARAGLVLYGLAFAALPSAGGAALFAVQVVLGVSSAAVFAAALQLAMASKDGRSLVMGFLNSAGSAGMLGGTAVSGIITAVVRRNGLPSHHAHWFVFACAAALPLLVAAAGGRLSRKLMAVTRPRLHDTVVTGVAKGAARTAVGGMDG